MCLRPPQNLKFGSSRRSRATTAKKCTKKRDAHAKLSFCQSKPIASLTFSLPSPSPLLKLPNQSYDYRPNWTPLSLVTITNTTIVRDWHTSLLHVRSFRVNWTHDILTTHVDVFSENCARVDSRKS